MSPVPDQALGWKGAMRELRLVGGAVNSWIVQSTRDQEGRVGLQSLSGTIYCVLEKGTLISQCNSLVRCINGYW